RRRTAEPTPAASQTRSYPEKGSPRRESLTSLRRPAVAPIPAPTAMLSCWSSPAARAPLAASELIAKLATKCFSLSSPNQGSGGQVGGRVARVSVRRAVAIIVRLRKRPRFGQRGPPGANRRAGRLGL